MTARAVMVLGTTSGAGKSWLATALCRWYARQGLRVAPFKAQNMSNNARVVPGLHGRAGEIGSAQYFQALAARCAPDVRMNPVLLKPEADTRSQVVCLGEVDARLSAMPWRERSELLWPTARAAFDQLAREFDLIVIEGAGSPAEINLHDSDFVNMRTALHANAACVLVTDIDRGGAFAHLYGTHQLLPQDERRLLRGFVLNRFRGDVSLLAPGPAHLQALTGVPTLAVLPMWRDHGLPEEDGLHDNAARGHGTLRVAIVAGPHISNLDEFQPLRQLEGVSLSWARQAREIDDADWVILPGSKSVAADLAWIRARGIDSAIVRHAGAGRPVLGICGGLQMLGEALVDPHGLDGNAPGLGLLPLVTRFEPDKLLRQGTMQFARQLPGPFSRLAGFRIGGYEIRHGRTVQHPSLPAAQVSLQTDEAGAQDGPQPIGWHQGSVMGLYAHGLFEQPGVIQALFAEPGRPLEPVFEGLADFIDRHFDPGTLLALLD